MFECNVQQYYNIDYNSKLNNHKHIIYRNDRHNINQLHWRTKKNKEKRTEKGNTKN